MDLFKTEFPNLSVYYFGTLSSTSEFLKDKAKESFVPSLCITELQTDGYGQRKTRWESDQESITFSLLVPVRYSIGQLVGFSQLLALSVKNSLAIRTKQNYKVKWPNDIYMGESKVAGLLVETVKTTNDLCWLVIGVGVNTGNFERQFEDYSAKGVPLVNAESKHSMVVPLIQGLLDTVYTYKPAAWLAHKVDWRESDYFQINETVCLKGALFDIGCYLGVSDSGSLLISAFNAEPDQGVVEITSGQVSVRRAKDTL